jgi:membrane-associated phospholipid phosphatase
MSLSLSNTHSHSATTTHVTSSWVATSIICLIVGASIFITAYIGIKHGSLHHMDLSVLQWFTSHRYTTVTRVMKLITTIVAPTTFACIILVGAALWAWRKKEVWRPVLLVGAMGFTLVVSTLVKATVGRSRPPSIDMIRPLEVDYSFPSGHTIGMAVCLLVLGYLLYSRKPSPHSLTTWIVVTILGTAIVAITRLYLGYHWLTDVTASFGLAMVILAVMIIIDLLVSRQIAKRSTVTA